MTKALKQLNTVLLLMTSQKQTAAHPESVQHNQSSSDSSFAQTSVLPIQPQWQWLMPQLPIPIAPSISMPRESVAVGTLVANTIIRILPGWQTSQQHEQHKKHAQRSKDKRPRAKQTCKRCAEFGGKFKIKCRGALANYTSEGCEYFLHPKEKLLTL